jgi:hypothetical protein
MEHGDGMPGQRSAAMAPGLPGAGKVGGHRVTARPRSLRCLISPGLGQQRVTAVISSLSSGVSAVTCAGSRASAWTRYL